MSQCTYRGDIPTEVAVAVVEFRTDSSIEKDDLEVRQFWEKPIGIVTLLNCSLIQTIMFHIILCIIRMNTIPVHLYTTQYSLLELAQVRNVSHLASPRDSHVYAIRMSNMTNARMLASLLMKITFIDVVRNVLVAQKSGIYGSTDFPFIHCYFIHIILYLITLEW